MSGECDICHEHTMDCECIIMSFTKQEIEDLIIYFIHSYVECDNGDLKLAEKLYSAIGMKPFWID